MKQQRVIPFLGTCALLIGTLIAVQLTSFRKVDSLAKPLEKIDRQLAGFVGTDDPPLTDSVLDQLKPTSYLSRTYRKDGLDANLFVAYYAQQRAGESMHSPKHCLPGAGWEIWDYGSTDLTVDAQKYTVNKYSISNAGQRMLVLYWYQSKNRIIASEYTGKLLLFRDALLRDSTAASIVRIIVPDRPDALEPAKNLAVDALKQLRQSFGA